jgi:hypothetical protein
MGEKEDRELRERAARAVFGDESYDASPLPHAIAVWVLDGELPTETLHRSLLPMILLILRVHAELEKDARRIRELEAVRDALKSGVRHFERALAVR